MTDNLFCSGADGITINANKVSLDLKGFTIDGAYGNAGIVVESARRDVKIANGTVTQFNYGIQLKAGSSTVLVDNMTVSENSTAGVWATNTAGVTLNRVIAGRYNGQNSDFTGGIVFRDGAGNTVQYSQFLENNRDGIRLSDESGFKAIQNLFRGNPHYQLNAERVHNLTLTGNVFEGDADYGPGPGGGPSPRESDYGIYVDCDFLGTGMSISSNTVRNNSAVGILVQDCSYLDSSTGSSSISGNKATDNGYDGLYLTGTAGLSLLNNVANGNGALAPGDGIYLVPAPGTVVRGNTTSGNSHAGIEIYPGAGAPNPTSDASGNVAVGNGDWGLWAQTAAPGRNNVASGNATGDCYGFVCKR